MKNESVIREMLYGKKGNYNELKPTKKYSELFNEIIEYEKIFLETLTPEQKEIYDKIDETSIEINGETADAFFEEGFKFGLLLGIEVAEK